MGFVLLIVLKLCYNISTQKGGGNKVAISEARKKANAKWDAENMTTLGCRLKRKQAEKFKAYCMGLGKTSNAVLREYVFDCIDEKGEPGA